VCSTLCGALKNALKVGKHPAETALSYQAG